jgi:signal transduction histidine kinase
LENREVFLGDPGLVSFVPAVGTPFGFDFDPEATSDHHRSTQVVRRALYDVDGSLLGHVELSEGPAYGRQVLARVAWGWGIASSVAVLLAAGVGWLASRRITRPLSLLTRVTARMAGGDLSARVDVNRQDELGALAHSFNDMAARVEETVSTLRRFVADAAHELHTPLTALRTNLELAPDEGFVKQARNQVERLEKLTTGLLNLSRIQADQRAPVSAPVVLNTLVQEVAELYASQAEQAGLVFELTMPESPIVVRADDAQLRDALGSLLDNAIKFTPQGGTIALSLSREKSWAVVRVRDTGIGIPAEDLPHVFGRFHRGSNAAAYPGSGLGLAIVKAIAARYDGTVEVEDVAQGTQLALRLPRHSGSAPLDCESRP